MMSHDSTTWSGKLAMAAKAYVVSMTVSELKEELKQRGLSTKGSKKDLRDRLEQALYDEELDDPESEAESDSAPTSYTMGMGMTVGGGFNFEVPPESFIAEEDVLAEYDEAESMIVSVQLSNRDRLEVHPCGNASSRMAVGVGDRTIGDGSLSPMIITIKRDSKDPLGGVADRQLGGVLDPVRVSDGVQSLNRPNGAATNQIVEHSHVDEEAAKVPSNNSVQSVPEPNEPNAVAVITTPTEEVAKEDKSIDSHEQAVTKITEEAAQTNDDNITHPKPKSPSIDETDVEMTKSHSPPPKETTPTEETPKEEVKTMDETKPESPPPDDEADVKLTSSPPFEDTAVEATPTTEVATPTSVVDQEVAQVPLTIQEEQTPEATTDMAPADEAVQTPPTEVEMMDTQSPPPKETTPTEEAPKVKASIIMQLETEVEKTQSSPKETIIETASPLEPETKSLEHEARKDVTVQIELEETEELPASETTPSEAIKEEIKVPEAQKEVTGQIITSETKQLPAAETTPTGEAMKEETKTPKARKEITDQIIIELEETDELPAAETTPTGEAIKEETKPLEARKKITGQIELEETEELPVAETAPTGEAVTMPEGDRSDAKTGKETSGAPPPPDEEFSVHVEEDDFSNEHTTKSRRRSNSSKRVREESDEASVKKRRVSASTPTAVTTPTDRKRRWGAGRQRVSSGSAPAINSDLIQDIIPVEVSQLVELGELEDCEEGLPLEEPLAPADEEKNREEDQRAVKELETRHRIEARLKAKREAELVAKQQERRRTPSPAKHAPSRILHIRGLTRPFTKEELRELLGQEGSPLEEAFWIDKIRSHCVAVYDTQDIAVSTRQRVHGVKWPSTNPKCLSVDYLSSAEVASVTDGQLFIQEEDKDAAPTTDVEPPPVAMDTAEEVPPSKPTLLLDELFRKTKTAPYIYWLPLTDAQVSERLAAVEEREKERETRRAAWMAQRKEEDSKARRDSRGGPEGREGNRRRETSPEGREGNRRRDTTPEGREGNRRRETTPEGREGNRRRNRSRSRSRERRRR